MRREHGNSHLEFVAVMGDVERKRQARKSTPGPSFAFFSVPWIVDVVKHKSPDRAFIEDRHGCLGRVMGDLAKAEVAGRAPGRFREVGEIPGQAAGGDDRLAFRAEYVGITRFPPPGYMPGWNGLDR